MAADIELESFILKFKHLCSAGINASLNVNSFHGKAVITLHAELGSFNAPEKVAQTPSKHRSPSYHRRLARRKAARMENVTNLSDGAEEVSSFLVNSQNESTAENSDDTGAVIVHSATNDIEENVCENNAADNVQKIEPEVDFYELQRDKLVNEILVSTVTEPIENVKDVEEEVKVKLNALGVAVVNMRTFDKRGMFDFSIVRISDINLNKIWGRRLGLKNCSIIEYKRPP